MKKISLIYITLMASFGLMLIAGSCSKDSSKPGLEYMPDMYRSPSLETYQPSGLFADSSSARTPVAGTIPRGFNTYFPFPATNEGYEAAGKDLKNPLEANEVNLKEGDRLYHIYCQHCHGDKGDGNGTLRIKGDKFPGVPNYATGKSSRGGDMKDMTDGKIYHTITYGLNLMGSHASQLDPDQRWKIVMYVHELQKGGSVAVADSSAAKDSTVKM